MKPCCFSFTYGQTKLEDVADGDVGRMMVGVQPAQGRMMGKWREMIRAGGRREE